jgi:hypothetical protein
MGDLPTSTHTSPSHVAFNGGPHVSRRAMGSLPYDDPNSGSSVFAIGSELRASGLVMRWTPAGQVDVRSDGDISGLRSTSPSRRGSMRTDRVLASRTVRDL